MGQKKRTAPSTFGTQDLMPVHLNSVNGSGGTRCTSYEAMQTLWG